MLAVVCDLKGKQPLIFRKDSKFESLSFAVTYSVQEATEKHDSLIMSISSWGFRA